MNAQTPQEAANERTVRKRYSLANATTKDTAGLATTPHNSKAPARKRSCGRQAWFRARKSIHKLMRN
jgi:hypothetical protein